MAFPSRINDLVQHFTQHIDSFKGSNYNETRARIEFIDPFFKELGWDIDNTQAFAEAYKDVIHEDAIKVEGLDCTLKTGIHSQLKGEYST